MAPARYQSVTPQASTKLTRRHNADKGWGRGGGGRGTAQTKGSFCFCPSLLSSGSKFILPKTLVRQIPEKEAEKAKHKAKLLPGLKWLK